MCFWEKTPEIRLHPHYPKQGSLLSTWFVPGGGELDHLADAVLVQFSTIRYIHAHPHFHPLWKERTVLSHLHSGGCAPPPEAGLSVSFFWSSLAWEVCLFFIHLFLESFIHISVTLHYSIFGVFNPILCYVFCCLIFSPLATGSLSG